MELIILACERLYNVINYIDAFRANRFQSCATARLNRITYRARSWLSDDLEDRMIVSEPPTNSATNVCSRIVLPCLLGEKIGRHLAVVQVAAKVYRPIESLFFFVRTMRRIG